MEITWLGHGTFLFRLPSGQVIVMDPWLDGNPAYPKAYKMPRVDTICISHGHFDHIHDAVPLAARFAPEVVAIEKRLGSTSGIDVIPELQPDWLVLRPAETDCIHAASPRLLTKAYSAVQFFDVSERLAAYRWLPGRGYLRYDEKFIVFKRNPPSRAADLGRH